LTEKSIWHISKPTLSLFGYEVYQTPLKLHQANHFSCRLSSLFLAPQKTQHVAGFQFLEAFCCTFPSKGSIFRKELTQYALSIVVLLPFYLLIEWQCFFASSFSPVFLLFHQIHRCIRTLRQTATLFFVHLLEKLVFMPDY